MASTAERMYDLFLGHTGGHGTYLREEKTPGKAKSVIKGTARTLRDPPTPELWQQHLEGKRPLGIVPINRENCCRWAVIDVDKYDLDHAAIVQKLEKLRLPMMVCRSKSGGAHLFIFLSEPVAAAEVIIKMKEIASVLGYGDCEIFPKQTEVLEERNDMGNWLNMPYFDAAAGNRYAVNSQGNGISIDQFLKIAENRKMSAHDFLSLSVGAKLEDPILKEGPPCLHFLCGVGIKEGGKNNTMFSLGVLAKKAKPEDWESLMDEWNHKYMEGTKLKPDEMQGIMRSLRKKEYMYRCKEQPLVAHCDKRVCSSRRWGIGAGSAPDISSISILDTNPPLFFVRLSSGGTVSCSSDDIISSRNFQRAALEQLHILLPLYKNENWQSTVQSLLEDADRIEAPREASTEGMFELLLNEFLTDRFAARERDEITLGKPWFSEEDSRYYFKLSDLMQHLERSKYREMRRGEIVTHIKNVLKGGHHFFNIKGNGVNVHWVPASSVSTRTEAFETPRPDGAVI